MLLHLFKYDSTQGRFEGSAELKDDAIVVNGKEIKVFANPNPEELPWGELGVDVVLECTGFFTNKTKAEAHIRAGARKVVISAPGGNDVKTVVYGVNQDILDGSETVISAASCTTNCLAPMAAVLQKEFGIVEGLMTTIHAYTGDQNAKAIGLVIPELNGKLDGSAQRVPVATGSLTELVSVLERPVTKEEINAAMKAAANDALGYTEDQIVSSDVIGIEYGSLFDATQTRVMTVGDKQLVKTVAWYDNEMSYTCQLVRTLEFFASKI